VRGSTVQYCIHSEGSRGICPPGPAGEQILWGGALRHLQVLLYYRVLLAIIGAWRLLECWSWLCAVWAGCRDLVGW